MAPFNWFNRRFDKSSEQDAETGEQSPAKEAAPSQPPSETAEPSAPTAPSEDYLNWAKAAYDNIRKRQQTEESEVSETPEPIAEESSQESDAVSDPALDPVSEAHAEPVASDPVASDPPDAPVTASEPQEVASEREPEPVAIETSEPLAAEAVPPTTSISEPSQAVLDASEPIGATSVPGVDPQSETSAAPLPFWAKAEAERLERLERLRLEAEANAAAEVESQTAINPQPAMTSASQTIAPPPEFVLDEGFLWSAEVLASQGRRPEDVSLEEITWLKRLRQGLDKTRRGLVNQLRAIVGQGPLNQDAVMEIESLLLQADVGIEATDYIIESLQNKLREEALPPAEAIAYLKQLLREMLDKPLGQSHSITFAPEKDKLNIWLITGVNGAGKTTTIGKIAHIANKSGFKCLIAAADTFRAAAVQQVKVWGERSEVEVIANPGKNTDPAAVVFDAITAAQSRGTELLLVDTAGRLQNKKNLMDELAKIRRIIDKKAPDAVVESLLVLDSTLGQNGLRQAEVFSEVAKLNGVVLTKLDGTARGGIALAVVQQLGLPIRFIGAGEGIEDLRPFSSFEFVEALLSG
jgi:fused signal recognition particle receptor